MELKLVCKDEPVPGKAELEPEPLAIDSFIDTPVGCDDFLDAKRIVRLSDTLSSSYAKSPCRPELCYYCSIC